FEILIAADGGMQARLEACIDRARKEFVAGACDERLRRILDAAHVADGEQQVGLLPYPPEAVLRRCGRHVELARQVEGGLVEMDPIDAAIPRLERNVSVDRQLGRQEQ